LASEKVVADLAALLEVEPIFDREPKTKRILSGGLEEIVANFDEVSAALRKRSITWA